MGMSGILNNIMNTRLQGTYEVTRQGSVKNQKNADKNVIEKKKTPDYDEYVPHDKSENQPIGLYRPVTSADGTTRIQFDDPEKKVTEVAEKKADDKVNNLNELMEELEESESEDMETTDTDKTDSENVSNKKTPVKDKVNDKLKRLKEKKQQLEQRLSLEDDPVKVEDLKRQITRIKQEMERKKAATQQRKNSIFPQMKKN